jgi:hypothetical protein
MTAMSSPAGSGLIMRGMVGDIKDSLLGYNAGYITRIIRGYVQGMAVEFAVFGYLYGHADI